MRQRLLVANRGEIAARVLRACRETGLPSVAVYSEADRDAPYLALADECHLLGPASPAESYLDIRRILEVARRTRATAIHPGYGFLAENADFAQACTDAGLKFVGPPAGAIRAIGNKIAARSVAGELGIPVIPGLSRGVDADQAASFAHEHGYPVLVKAASGGGGRGQRLVRSPDELGRALREASGEARSAFGDGTVFVERYIDAPRHVEIQVLADAHGGVIHLGERECSIQRRHQKLLEESPSPAVDDALRARMGDAACAIARRVGYESAGTCEFLLDSAGHFYFLEMNTRLQVEHPVTEMVTGLDLVKLQLVIAGGAGLPLAQSDVRRSGHAIEARICAEDPRSNFAPSIGEIASVRLPGGPFVRVDADIAPGVRVTPHYDSLLAKLVVWGADRPAAIDRLARALREFAVIGVQTTVPFHLALLRDERFRAGRVHTRFVETEFRMPESPGADEDVALIVAALELARRARNGHVAAPETPLDPWRMAFRQDTP